jgi:tetratricopeptide (TPR) repeat protein
VSDAPLSLEAALERFVAQARSERPVSAREFAALHPELAPDLLPALEAAEDLESLRHESEADLPEGLERLGHFRIECELGRGGMGVVYAAFDEELGRSVALKLLPRALLNSAPARARFQREANLAARLEHPSICAVHSAGVTDGRPWIAMRRLQGHSLAETIASARKQRDSTRKTPSLPRAQDLARCIGSIARALAFAHARGVIHRDVKPSNVMVTDEGQAVLLDFGVAFDVDLGAPQLTRTGETAGTPAYLAPELISGELRRPDERCDVYALGVTLYECLTLRQPYAAPTRDALYRTILDGGAADVRRWDAEIPKDLAVIVATAIERDPGRRYASAEAFANDLEAFVAGRGIAARQAGNVERVLRWARREPRQAGLAGALLATALAAAVVAGMLFSSREQAAAGRAVQRKLALEESLARAYANLGQSVSKGAIGDFERVLELDPDSAEARLGQILAHLRGGRDAAALALLRDSPRTPAFERLQHASSPARSPSTARPWTTIPRGSSAPSAFELFAASEALRLEGERKPPSEQKLWWRKALERIDEAIARAPQARAVYHQMRALHASKLGDKEAARSASQALVTLWPDSAWSLYQAGCAVLEIDARRAIELLERSAKLDPTRAATFQCIGIAHFNLGDYEAALLSMRQALALNPLDVLAYNGLGAAWMRMGCTDEARGAFLDALSIDPRAIAAWANLTLLEPGAAETAAAAAQVLALDPGQSGHRAIYAQVLLQLDDPQRSRDEFARLVAEHSQNPAYWAAYATALATAGDLENGARCGGHGTRARADPARPRRARAADPGGDPSPLTRPWRARRNARAHFFGNPGRERGRCADRRLPALRDLRAPVEAPRAPQNRPVRLHALRLRLPRARADPRPLRQRARRRRAVRQGLPRRSRPKLRRCERRARRRGRASTQAVAPSTASRARTFSTDWARPSFGRSRPPRTLAINLVPSSQKSETQPATAPIDFLVGEPGYDPIGRRRPRGSSPDPRSDPRTRAGALRCRWQRPVRERDRPCLRRLGGTAGGKSSSGRRAASARSISSTPKPSRWAAL